MTEIFRNAKWLASQTSTRGLHDSLHRVLSPGDSCDSLYGVFAPRDSYDSLYGVLSPGDSYDSLHRVYDQSDGNETFCLNEPSALQLDSHQGDYMIACIGIYRLGLL